MDDGFAAYLASDLWLGQQVEVITPEQLSATDAVQVPQRWLDIVSTPGRPAVAKTLTMWRDAIGDRLPRLLDLIDRFGHSVQLARVAEKFQKPHTPPVVLLYVFHDPVAFPGGFEMRIGFPPYTPQDLPEFWTSLPDSIRNLYQQVHDGYSTNLWAGVAGLLPAASMLGLDDSFDRELLHHSVCGPADLHYYVRGPSDLYYHYVRDERGEFLQDCAGEAADPDLLPDLSALVAVCKHQGTARLFVDTGTDESHAWELWEYNLEYWPNLWARIDHWLVQAFVTDGYRPPR